MTFYTDHLERRQMTVSLVYAVTPNEYGNIILLGRCGPYTVFPGDQFVEIIKPYAMPVNPFMDDMSMSIERVVYRLTRLNTGPYVIAVEPDEEPGWLRNWSSCYYG